MNRLFLVFAVPAALLLYGIALEAPMQLDDGPVLATARSPHQGLRAAGFDSFWLTHQAYAVFRKVFPFKPEAYHRLANIIIHALAATALFALTRQLTDDSFIAAVAGILFLVHPVQTQAITYISQRFESQAAMFMIASAAAYVHFRKARSIRWLLISVVAAGLAFMSKETSIVLPVWLLLIEVCFFDGKILRSRLVYFAGLGLLLVKPLWDTFSGSATFKWIPWQWYFASQGPVLLKYLQLCVWPREQFLYYDFPPVEALTWLVILQWLAVLAVLATGIYLVRRSDRVIGFGILSFFVLLLVVTLLPLPDMIFEHRVYPAFAGIAIAVAGLAARMNRKVAIAAVAAAVLALGARTIIRNAQWNDDIAFLELHRAKFPHDPDILARLGAYYFGHGQVNKALEVSEEAQRYEYRLNSYYSQSRRTNIASNLVTIYLAKRDLKSATREARRAVALDPTEAFALRSLAAVEMEARNFAAARDAWRRLIEVEPDKPQGWTGLREAYRGLGDSEGVKEAEAHLSELQKNSTQPAGLSIEIPERFRSHIIFGTVICVLLIAFWGFQAVFQLLNQRKLRINAPEDRPSV